MDNVVFNPGCALSVYKPDMEGRVLALLQKHYRPDIALHTICCKHDPQLPQDSLIIIVCAGCHRRFRELYEGIRPLSLWEVLDGLADFPFPDYGGAQMSLHDPCPIRPIPEIHQAVRSLLRKMNIELIEAAHVGAHSVCCGDSFYPELPVPEVNALMKKRAASMPCEAVAVYCASCIKSMHIGGKRPRYLLDLLMGEETHPQVYETTAWHNQIEAYAEAH